MSTTESILFLRVRIRNSIWKILIVVALGSSGVLANAQSREAKVALVIGNDRYSNLSDLNNAVNDATAIGETLSALGFDVRLETNIERRFLYRAIFEFETALKRSDVGVVYYAGHGLQDGDDRNYLVPTDAHVEHSADMRSELVPISDIVSMMETAGAPVNILILDACRNNPLQKSVRSVDTRGLKEEYGPRNLQSAVLFAAAPGKVAIDGSPGEHGVFTGELLKALEEPGLTVGAVFERTANGVAERTNGDQTPFMSISISDKVYFNPPVASTLASAARASDIVRGFLTSHHPRSGTIERDGGTHIYRIEVTSEAPIVSIFSSSSLDTRGSLSRGTDKGIVHPFSQDDDSGEDRNFRLYAVLDPGTYYVGVTGSEPGEYVVHFDTYSAVHLEQRVTATVAAPGDVHYFVTSVPEISSVGVEVDGDIYADVELLRKTAEGILVQVPIDEQSGLYDYLAPGKYYVSVRGLKKGDYEVHLTRYIILSSSSMTKTTYGFNGIDIFQFNVSKDRPYITVYTTGQMDTRGLVRLGGVIDPDDSMYLSDGEDDDSGDDSNFRISTDLEEGTYLIEVRWNSKSVKDEYSIYLVADRSDSRSDTPLSSDDELVPLQSIPLRGTLEGTLAYRDVDAYEIEVSENEPWISIGHYSTADIAAFLIKDATSSTPFWKRVIHEGYELIAIGTFNWRSSKLSRVLDVGSYYVVLLGISDSSAEYSIHAMPKDLPKDHHGGEMSDATLLTSSHWGWIHGDDVDYFRFVVTDEESWVKIRVTDDFTDDLPTVERFTFGQLILYEEGKGALVVGQDLRHDPTRDIDLLPTYWLPGLADSKISKLLDSGTYYVKIQSIAAAARLGTIQLGGSEFLETWPLDVGSYTIDLRIDDVPEDSHADDLEGATALADVAEGWIGGDDVDHFRFEVPDSEPTLHLHTRARRVMIDVSTELRVKVTILNRKAGETREIESVEEDPVYGSSIVMDLEPGTYYVRVETFEPRGAGPYTIDLKLHGAVEQPTEDAL